MDEDESKSSSLGAYENMERSDIHPDFYSEDEDDEKSNKSSAAKDALKKGEQAAVRKGVEKGAEVALNAATGGVGGTAAKALGAVKGAEKLGGAAASAAASGDGKSQDLMDGKSTIVKAAPIIVLLIGLIILYGVVSFIGQWLFPVGFKSREVEDWNSTKVSTTERTDALTDNTQLGSDGSSQVYSGVVFEDMGFTDEQITGLAQAGIEYSNEGGEKALIFHKNDGSNMVVVSSDSVGATKGETVADGSSILTDSGDTSNEVAIEERKQEILANLGIAATGSSVVGFKEAMQDWNFKERFMIGTRSWRGDISGWFSELTETVVQRLGISRNNFRDFELTGKNDEDEATFLEMAQEKPAANPESDYGDKSFKERVEEVANNSEDPDCGAISAANDIEGVITADQTARQVSAGSMWLEAIDKTIAGEGTGTALSAMNNIIVRNGAADTEGIHHLFGSGELDQHDDNLLSVSMQANIGGNGTADIGAVDEETYRQCVYEGNTNVKGLKGALVKIGSMFKKVLNWAKGAINILKGFLGGAAGGAADVAVSVLDPTIAKYEQVKDQRFFTGDDTPVLGEALVSSAERIMGEKAKTAGQTIGDNTAVLAFYRDQQEVIAEQAEFDRRTKSPFDVTSEHTFLGSLAYSLIPLATSMQSVSVTSMVGGIGSLFSSALTNLLPTSSAVSETDFTFSRGDCVLANSTTAISNGYCNQYYVTDLSQIDMTPVEIFDSTALMREDRMGYVYGKGHSRDKTGAESGPKSDTDPDWGDKPLNESEKSLAHHWPSSPVMSKIQHYDGTANGCETDWEYNFINYPLEIYGTDFDNRQYHLDEPVEWSYSRVTNFEYLGYKTGWHNRNNPDSPTAAGIEEAVNDALPELCALDMKVDSEDDQPVINMNGALMSFMVMSGQRGSDWGVTDDNNLQRLIKTDFIKGRLHPAAVGATNQNVAHPNLDSAEAGSGSIYEKIGWTGSEDSVAASKFMSRWIGGTAYTMATAGGSTGGSEYTSLDLVFDGSDEAFKDPTRNDDYFWNEMKIYQAYVELLEWMQAIGKIKTTQTGAAIAKYYDKNPLDNSYEGIIARYSGMSKDRVVAVLDLLNYAEFLAKYDASELYPLGPKAEEVIQYDNMEIVAQAEQAVQQMGVVYDELRNRTVTV
ncbi:hypothetical protein IJG78_01185 [Candidatus Saccharibacteria bacterium]|nr:hypothetical protein [Candidatus Saccharibacteria bacterium]